MNQLTVTRGELYTTAGGTAAETLPTVIITRDKTLRSNGDTVYLLMRDTEKKFRRKKMVAVSVDLLHTNWSIDHDSPALDEIVPFKTVCEYYSPLDNMARVVTPGTYYCAAVPEEDAAAFAEWRRENLLKILKRSTVNL